METTDYYIKLGRRVENINDQTKEVWHIVSPELTGRISMASWQAFLRFLKKNYPCRLNWGLYPNQPVYEYQARPEDLEISINYFLKNNLNETLPTRFERFEYDKDFVPGEIPETHQQHLSL